VLDVWPVVVDNLIVLDTFHAVRVKKVSGQSIIVCIGQRDRMRGSSGFVGLCVSRTKSGQAAGLATYFGGHFEWYGR